MRAVTGLCMICIVAFSAIGAQSASAVTKGTTAYTCKVPGVGDTPVGASFSDAHCTVAGGSTRHVEIPANTTTHTTVGNENTQNGTTESTPFSLKATVATIPIKITATGVTTTNGAWLENKTEGAEHYAFGKGKVLFTGVVVHEPANCTVVQGARVDEIETEELEGTTKGQGDFVKFAPVTGNVIAEFEIVNSGGTCAAAQKVKIIGSVKGKPNGATIEFTHEEGTTQGTLRFGSAVGPKAGLEGKLTVKAGRGGLDES
ncbi:MAG TPA: hypothetical protein VMS11_02130 [Solirubrobacterales bacterium]|nr:hypothetical protein [Solirubrobacterales bacterium]